MRQCEFADEWGKARSAAQKLLKNDGLVVLFVFCAEEQGGRSFGYRLFQDGEGFVILLELGSVAGFELRPSGGVVREPFSEVVTGANVFEP